MLRLTPCDSLSRRRLMLGGAAAFGLAPVIARGQSAPQPAASSPGEDTGSGNEVDAATDAARHLTIAVTINGQGPFQFVVDTGADRTVLSDTVATNLGLSRGALVMVQGVVRSLPAQMVPVRDLSFGAVRRTHLGMPILPRTLLQADGYLGLDVIGGYRVILDFKNHALAVDESPPRFITSIVRPDETRIPVLGKSGHLRAVDCLVDGVRADALIDTGAEMSVGNQPLLDELLRRSPEYAKFGAVPLTGVTGGTLMGRSTYVSEVKLNELKFANCEMAIADLQIFDIWGLAQKPALLIGMDYLRKFSRVVIDYRWKELRFEFANLTVAQRA